jgi:hypothetical protein
MFNGTELSKLIFAGELNLLLAANTIFMYYGDETACINFS